MLCSFPTTAKRSGSGDSKWLNRLRSSKGFPDSDHIDIEQFLSNSLDKIHPETYPNPDKSLVLDGNLTTEIHDDGVSQGRGAIDNVLSELFYMGESKDLPRIKRKKNCRKQRCPKFCVISSNLNVDDVLIRKDRVSSPLPLNLNNRLEVKEMSEEMKVREHGVKDVKEEVYGYFPGNSQSEIMVIDTSVPSWKFEKMLFRIKNVWKVEDKKGNGLMKRKLSLNENTDGKKKMFKVKGSSKYADKKEVKVQSNSTEVHDKGKKMEATYEETQNNSSQLQENSSLKKHIDGSSSITKRNV